MKFLPILLFALSAFGTIIPADRIYPWQGNVGVPGGVPNVTTMFCNVLLSIPGTNRVAVGDNSTDDTIALQTAINLCPSNQYVYLPAATYKTTAALSLKGRNGVVVRGAGRGLTTIEPHSTSGSVFAFGTDGNNYEQYEFGSPTFVANITAGNTLASSNITVSSTSGLVVGGLINIDELNDTNGYLKCIPVGNEGFNSDSSRSQDGSGTRCLGQVCVITAIAGSVVTIDPPLVWWFTNASPQTVGFPLQTSMAGVENLTVDNNNTGIEQSFSMWAVKWCWIKNVESMWSDGDHVIVDSSARCEIRDSYFHDSYAHTSGSHDSTIVLRCHASGILVENNIMRRLHIGTIIENGGGCASVIAYNFMTNQFDSGATLAMYNDIEYHGSHVLMLLCEGNVINSFNQDGVWGTATAGTLLRNFVSGQDWDCPPFTGRGSEQTGSYQKQTQGNRCVTLAGVGLSQYFNVVGNVLGTTNMGSYPSFNPVYTNIWPMFQNYDHEGRILVMGYACGSDTGAGGGQCAGFDVGDNNTPWLTLINHGNWDVVNKAQIWSNSIPDQVIPQSYYLTGKPSFFGTCTWPPIDPGTATNDNTFQITNVPAVRAFFNLPVNLSPPPSVIIGGGATFSGGASIAR